LLYISNFIVRDGKFKEFQKWIKENEKDISEYFGKIGLKYLGTYFYNFGPSDAHGCMMYKISKYGDLDASRNKWKEKIRVKWSEALVDLLASDPTPAWILQEAGETRIYDFE
jgi:hypothetical protein